MRLLYEGKQREDSLPLSYYNIKKDASVMLSLCLRGGAYRQTSSAPPFSYKDVLHSQPSKGAAQPAEAPKPFLVDKREETPSIEISHPTLEDQFQTFA